MAEFVYLLCAITAISCAVLLFRGYKARRSSLLFWSSLCFVGFALNNILLLVDLYIFPDVDLFPLRTGIALLATGLLVFGLIWDTR